MTPEAVIDWAIQTAVAFVATIAFAIIFHTPREQYVCAGLVGAFSWLIYIVYVYFTGDVVFASFFAALGLTYLARVFSFARKAPLPVFLIAGIFPVVPGAGIYYTGYHIFMNNNVEAMSKGVETIKIAIAIALGIGIVVSLPRFFFTLRRKGSTTRNRSPSLKTTLTSASINFSQKHTLTCRSLCCIRLSAKRTSR